MANAAQRRKRQTRVSTPPPRDPPASRVVPDDDDDDESGMANDPAAYTSTEEEIDLDTGSAVAENGDAPPLYRVVPEAPRIRALLYGEPGCGKTSLAATAMDHERMSPVVFANIEGGLISVGYRRDIHAVDIGETKDLINLYYAIKNKVAPYDAISTLVIDNVTELQTQNLEEIVVAEVSSSNKRVSIDDIWQEDYGTSTSQLLRLFRWFKGLDINLILTAHAKFVYPPNRNTRQGTNMNIEPTAVLPYLTQKLCKSTMGLVDYVWYLSYDAEADKRYLLTRPDGIIAAKTRGKRFAAALGTGVEIPDPEQDPLLPRLYDLLVESESGNG